jgi:hypothetical protein
MRRLLLIYGMLLTLTAGVWSSALVAVASAWCMHGANASNAAQASDEHDCCRAKTGEPDAPHSESTAHAHDADASHENALSQTETSDSHAGMNCAAAEKPENESKAASAFGEGVRSCFECCAGRANQTPTNATLNAPEQNRVKRAPTHASVSARDLFAPVAQGVSQHAPSQHAPPTSGERRHKLINVFLI